VGCVERVVRRAESHWGTELSERWSRVIDLPAVTEVIPALNVCASLPSEVVGELIGSEVALLPM